MCVCVCGSESGGGSLVLRLPSESVLCFRGDVEEQGTAGWTALGEEEFFNAPSFVF